MGLGSALKGAAHTAGPAFLSGLGQSAGTSAGGALGGGQQGAQALPLLGMPQPTPPMQIQPVVSSGSSAAPLNFSAGNAMGVTPANNMNPQILRLIQMLGAIKGG